MHTDLKKVYFAANYWKIPTMLENSQLTVDTGRGVLIAVLDTGIDSCHRIFQEDQTPKKIALKKNFVLPDDDVICHADDPEFDQHPDSHGTAVASIIAGGKMSVPFEVKKEFDFPLEGPFAVGVASKASLVICRVAHTNVDIKTVNAALQWIVDHNNVILKTPPECETLESLETRHEKECELDHSNKNNKIPIVNMSFKVESNLKMETLILKLKEQKVVCVAGCGNDGGNRHPGYPALYQNVLSVGAADCYGNECSFSSQHQSGINVYALGQDVLVAKTSNMFERTRGTSYAVPAVCGLIAILLQQARDQEDELNKSCDQATQKHFAEYVTDIALLRKLISRHFFGGSKLLKQENVETFLRVHIRQVHTVIKDLHSEMHQSITGRTKYVHNSYTWVPKDNTRYAYIHASCMYILYIIIALGI